MATEDSTHQQQAHERTLVRITPTSAVVGVAVVVLVLMAQRIFIAAHRPLSWAAAAVVVAVLIDPLVGALGTRIPRAVAVLGALLVVGSAVFGLVYVAADDLSAGLERLGNTAQDAADRIEDRDDNVGQLARDIAAERRVEDLVDAVEDRATGGDEVLATTAGTAPTYFVGAILTVFLMSYGPAIARSGLTLVDDHRGQRLSQVVGRAIVRARRAILATLAEGIACGIAVGVAATLLDVHAAAALGFTAGVIALLPHVGLTLGTLPLLLLVLGLRDDGAVVAPVALGVVMVIQVLDSMLVRPRIAERSVHIGLVVPWVVTLLGYSVYGVGGAAYGLAVAVFGLAVLDELDPDLDTEPSLSPGTDGGVVPAAEGH